MMSRRPRSASAIVAVKLCGSTSSDGATPPACAVCTRPQPAMSGLRQPGQWEDNRAMTLDQARRIELRRLLADDWRIWRGLRLAALDEAPHAFGSSLADWTGTGGSEDRWRSRLTAVPFNLAAYLRGSEAGMVSGADLGDGTAEL